MEIQILDQRVGASASSSFKMEIPKWTLTARELIRMRVEESIRLVALEPAVDTFDFTNDPLGETKKKRSAHPTSPDRYVAAALEAFEKNGFFMLVDDVQVGGLDDMIELTPTSEVTFVRLVPLVGG